MTRALEEAETLEAATFPIALDAGRRASAVATPGKREAAVGRVVELDALRGLAAAGVLLFHLPLGFWFGATGVDLFFVLSRYLITGIILRNQGMHGFLRAFYARRALRIFPIYYLALAIVVAINSLHKHPDSMRGMPFCLFYVQGIQHYWGATPPPLLSNFGHSWTLAIEEQFYPFWPLAVTTLGRKRFWLLGSALLILPLVLRSIGLSGGVLLGHCEGLALGGILAGASEWLNHSKARRRLALMLALSLPCVFLFRHAAKLCEGHSALIFESGGLLAMSLSYCALVGLVVSGAGHRSLWFLRLAPLAALGQISYGLYLYHWIIYENLDAVFKFGMHCGDPWWLDLLKVATALTAAAASWRWIEKPILRLKDKFSYAA
jgi:peptidoglycan/LPS O-acetylase OafA/YrhL